MKTTGSLLFLLAAISATPALLDGKVYVRTNEHLHAFRLKE